MPEGRGRKPKAVAVVAPEVGHAAPAGVDRGVRSLMARCPRCGADRLVPLGSSPPIALLQCGSCAYVWAEPEAAG